MKNLILFGVLVLLLVSAQFAQAQTVDDVINKHIDALGGKANIAKIQSTVSEGSLNYNGIEIGVTLTQVNGKLNRQDISVNGMTGFDMLTDKDGWAFAPYQGMTSPEAKSAEEVKENQSDLDIAGPLVDYAAKGHKVELVAGKETVNGKSCFVVKASLKTGKLITFFIDADSYMIVRATDKRNINGEQVDLQTDLADYKDVDGVKMPFAITQQFGTVNLSSIKANTTIPESAYKHDK